MHIQISENIRRLRRERGLTQEQLAETLGVTLSAVSKWETGTSTPDLERLVAIAECFGTSVDTLLSYEYHQESLSKYIGQIKALCREEKFEKCTKVIEQAVNCYTNNFEINYLGAQVYYLIGAKLHNTTALERSIALFNRALELCFQNTDPSVNSWTIQNDIAQVYLFKGDIEKALEILKENNAAGFNDQAIGYALSCNARRGKEACPYLSRALVATLIQLDRIFVAYANVFEQAGEYPQIIDVLERLTAVLDIFRIPEKVSYLDKMTAKALSGCAQTAAFMGDHELSERYLEQAEKYAERYDTDPQNSFQNIRFCGDSSDLPALFDDFGETAMDGIEKTMHERSIDMEATRLLFGKL